VHFRGKEAEVSMSRVVGISKLGKTKTVKTIHEKLAKGLYDYDRYNETSFLPVMEDLYKKIDTFDDKYGEDSETMKLLYMKQLYVYFYNEIEARRTKKSAKGKYVIPAKEFVFDDNGVQSTKSDDNSGSSGEDPVVGGGEDPVVGDGDDLVNGGGEDPIIVSDDDGNNNNNNNNNNNANPDPQPVAIDNNDGKDEIIRQLQEVSDDRQSQIVTLESEVAQLEEKVKTLETDVLSITTDKERLVNEKESEMGEREVLDIEITRLKTENKEKEDEMNAKNLEIEALKRVSEQSDISKQMIVNLQTQIDESVVFRTANETLKIDLEGVRTELGARNEEIIQLKLDLSNNSASRSEEEKEEFRLLLVENGELQRSISGKDERIEDLMKGYDEMKVLYNTSVENIGLRDETIQNQKTEIERLGNEVGKLQENVRERVVVYQTLQDSLTQSMKELSVAQTTITTLNKQLNDSVISITNDRDQQGIILREQLNKLQNQLDEKERTIMEIQNRLQQSNGGEELELPVYDIDSFTLAERPAGTLKENFGTKTFTSSTLNLLDKIFDHYITIGCVVFDDKLEIVSRIKLIDVLNDTPDNLIDYSIATTPGSLVNISNYPKHIIPPLVNGEGVLTDPIVPLIPTVNNTGIRLMTVGDHIQRETYDRVSTPNVGTHRVEIIFSDQYGTRTIHLVASNLSPHGGGSGEEVAIDIGKTSHSIEYKYVTHMGRFLIYSKGSIRYTIYNGGKAIRRDELLYECVPRGGGEDGQDVVTELGGRAKFYTRYVASNIVMVDMIVLPYN
jgi:hypothetical protein